MANQFPRNTDPTSETYGLFRAFEPHSCKHCESIVIREEALGEVDDAEVGADHLADFRNVLLAPSWSDAFLARRDGCALFAFFLDEVDHRFGLTQEEIASTYPGPVYGSLTRRGFKLHHSFGPVALSNMLRVDIPFGYAPPLGITARTNENVASEGLMDCDIASTEAFQAAQKWIDHCDAFHDCRQVEDPSFAPTRLLQVGGDELRLVGSARCERPVRWCSLSYVWGGDQPVKTTTATLIEHEQGIEKTRLPQAIQDAATVCSRLGIRYLWVDSLCIVQDDTDDLARELQAMAKIYRDAYLTLCASSSRGATEGFLQKRGFYFAQVQPIKLKYAHGGGSSSSSGQEEGEEAGRIAEVLAYELNHPTSEPIERRAWTFQEKVLSPRRLQYKPRSLEWTCLQAVCAYGPPDGHLPNPSRSTSAGGGGNGNSLIPSWSEAVNEYSVRNLTFGGDKLRAISAVAREYGKAQGGLTYLAGLWREDLLFHMCWLAFPRDTIELLLVAERPRGPYRAPSWSWASIDAGIVYAFQGQGALGVTWEPAAGCEVLEASVTPAWPGGEYDSITAGHVTVKGTMHEVQFRLSEDEDEPSSVDVVVIGSGHHHLLGTIDAMEDGWQDGGEDTEEAHVVESAWALLVARRYDQNDDPGMVGLLLVEDDEHAATYKRVGFFQCCEDTDEADHKFCEDKFLQFQERVITII